MMLPMCVGCRKEKCKPILVGTVNQVDKERERQKTLKAKKVKRAAVLPASSEEEQAVEVVSGGGDGKKRTLCTSSYL